jgi:hypothetical protein
VCNEVTQLSHVVTMGQWVIDQWVTSVVHNAGVEMSMDDESWYIRRVGGWRVLVHVDMSMGDERWCISLMCLGTMHTANLSAVDIAAVDRACAEWHELVRAQQQHTMQSSVTGGGGDG